MLQTNFHPTNDSKAVQLARRRFRQNCQEAIGAMLPPSSETSARAGSDNRLVETLDEGGMKEER